MAQARKQTKRPVSGKKNVRNYSKTQKKFVKNFTGKYKKQSKKKKQQQGVSSLILIILILIAGFVYFRFFNEKERFPIAEGDIAVHFIDVGQGDSIFIESGGETMLIDCGESSETDKVISYLEELNVEKLDYVIATHPHSDHMGGMYKIIDEFDIDKVMIPHLDSSDTPTTRYFEKFLDSCNSKNITLSYARKGNVIHLGSSEAEVIAPCSDDYSNVNNYSVGIFLMHGKTSFILTGDAEKLAEDEMIESGSLRHADVYKAGHHGSDTSGSQDFMDIISPDYAVISCGAGNSYGHPCESTLERLSQFTDKIYRTDLCGTIVFVSDGENITVKTER